MTPDLNSAEKAAIAAVLKDAIERDPFPQLDRRMVVRRADEDEADHPK